MLKLNSKKGMVLYYIIIIGFVAALAMYFVNSLYVKPAEQKGYPGEFQLKFLEGTSKITGERIMIEQMAKEKAREAILLLAERGGFDTAGSECDGNYWNLKSKWCLPDYKKNLIGLLDDKIKVNGVNYEYFVEGKIISGAADDVLMIDIKEKGGLLGQVALRPSFNVDVGYDIDKYEKMFGLAQELVEVCRGSKGKNLTDCIGVNSKWEICGGDELKKLFCVKGGFYRVFENGLFVDKQLEYKFGLDFE